MELYPHQKRALDTVRDYGNAGFFLDMGLGKTYIGAEKMRRIGNRMNLLICQKSKIDDWAEHFAVNVDDFAPFDLTNSGNLRKFMEMAAFETPFAVVGIINYELAFRREQLQRLEGFTLMLDESSLIQNENAKRTRYILDKLRYSNVILLSGTVVNGNYEKLWSQCNLLGWPISKELFYRQYMTWETIDVDGFKRKVRTGYRNIDRLKRKLADYGAVFVKTGEVFDLPEQIEIPISVEASADYRRFERDRIVRIEDRTLIGDMQLTERLYKRMLCGAFSDAKMQAFRDLAESTDDRLIVFYSFSEECRRLSQIAEELQRPVSIVSGERKDFAAYERAEDSITFVQYQAGAMGLNLQKANKTIYYTLPDGGAELFEQSKKRTHRIGQDRPCFYYVLYCRNTIEDREIMPNLRAKTERIDGLFQKGNAE